LPVPLPALMSANSLPVPTVPSRCTVAHDRGLGGVVDGRNSSGDKAIPFDDRDPDEQLSCHP
jgi:hypothetical protein